LLVDTHCHLTHPSFGDDLEEVLGRAAEAGVSRMVSIASNVADAEDALARIADGRRVWTTAGVHPHEASGAGPSDWERIRQLASHPWVVAVGECGLDFHYDHSPRDAQFQAFEAQIEIAAESRLPLVVHSRSADADMVDVLGGMPAGVVGVLHCFSGSPKLLDAALSRGWYISVTGVVTFRRFDGAAWLRAVPEDRLMIETDSPYMAPVPHRGKRNEPAFVAGVAEAVALHRGESVEHVQAYTSRNAAHFYSLPVRS